MLWETKNATFAPLISLIVAKRPDNNSYAKKNMERLTMWSTWTWKVAPVFFILIPMIIGFSNPGAWYFCIFVMGSAIFIFFFSKAKIWLELHNIYIGNQNLIIQRSVSAKPNIEVPFDNALKVEYIQFAQQIIGKFWYFEPKSLKRTFIYFWPTIAEAKWDTSKLYQICAAADYKREKNKA